MKAKHAIGFVGKAVKLVAHAARTGEVYVPEEIAEQRREICRSARCEYFNQDEDRCDECGCPVEEKAKYVIMKCPVDKWPDKTIDDERRDKQLDA